MLSIILNSKPQWNGVQFEDNGPVKGVSSVDSIVTPKAFPVKDLTALPRPHQRIRSINELGATPKAVNLENQWGTNKAFNIQGPKGDPKLLNQQPWAATTLGEMQGNRQVTISRNQAVKGGEIDPLADSPILKRKLLADSVSCIIELKKNQPYCSMQNGSCQKCSSSDVCVQNFATSRCLPGDQSGDTCKNSTHFAQGVSKCNNSLASGTVFNNIDNLQGRKVKSIQAQSRKRLGATGPWWNEIDEAGKTRVVSGSFTNLSPEDFSVREPVYVDRLTSGQPTPADWKPTLNPDQDVISGNVGSLSKDARSLVNPGIPSVMNSPSDPPLQSNKVGIQ